jgi:hypothetical protein
MAPRGVSVTVAAEARAPLASTFATIAPIPPERIFRGFGPLPTVTRTRAQSGGWDHVGATRVVELADGSEARERLTAYEAPSHFGYRLSGFTGPLRHLVSHADGEWWFSDRGDATDVRWTYVFYPRTGRGAAIAPLWRRYQQRALALAIAEATKAVA